MAKKKPPVDVKKLLDIASDLGQARGWDVNVNLVFDITASDELIDLVLEAFTTDNPQATVRKVVLEGTVPALPLPADLCIIVGGTSLILGDVAAASRRMGTPTVVVVAQGQTYFAESVTQAEGLVPAAATGKGIPIDDIVDIDLLAEERPLEALGTWITRNAPAKRVSMCDCFCFIRHALANVLVSSAAARAAATGVLIFIPGADMPAITLEQCQMMLQIASVYGQPLDRSRVKEIAAVVASAFGFRAIARELCGLLPGLGWGVKGAVAYGGTLSIGVAAVDYFEEDGVIAGLADTVRQAADEFVEELRQAQTQQEEQPAC